MQGAVYEEGFYRDILLSDMYHLYKNNQGDGEQTDAKYVQAGI